MVAKGAKRGRDRLGSIKELSHDASGSHVGVRDNEAYHHDRRVCLARACAYNTCTCRRVRLPHGWLWVELRSLILPWQVSMAIL